jgi:hypothetical protein
LIHIQTSEDDDLIARLNKLMEINKRKNDETFGPSTPSSAVPPAIPPVVSPTVSNTSDTIVVDANRRGQTPESLTRNGDRNVPAGQSPIQAALEKEVEKGSQAPTALMHPFQTHKSSEKNVKVVNGKTLQTVDTPFGLGKFPTKRHAADAPNGVEVAPAKIQTPVEPSKEQKKVLKSKTGRKQPSINDEVLQEAPSKQMKPRPKPDAKVPTLKRQEASIKQVGPQAKSNVNVPATREQSPVKAPNQSSSTSKAPVQGLQQKPQATSNGGLKDLCRELPKMVSEHLAIQIAARYMPGEDSLHSSLKKISTITIRHLEADLEWALKKHEDDEDDEAGAA